MSKCIVITVLVLFGIMIAAMPVYSAEVFVFVSTSTGSDLPGSGSIVSPYASIGYAISQNPGTASDPVTIFVAVGVYQENLSLTAYQSLNGGYSIDFSARNLDDLTAPGYATIINGGDIGRVIVIDPLSNSTKEISGFSIVDGNSTTVGGGIHGNLSYTSIRYNRIYGNTASLNGGGMYGCDGVIEYCEIFNNISGVDGGGLASCWANITECHIYSNTAYSNGGGLYYCNGNIIQDCEIYNNRAYENGGGLSDCNIEVEGCSIHDNEATDNGGGIYNCNDDITNNLIYSNTANVDGGGISLCSGDVLNNTIFENHAGNDGGGIDGCSGAITNCIIYANTASVPLGAQGSPSNSFPGYCCIQDWLGTSNGNFSDDPVLVRPDLNQFHLAVGSPCINAGTDAGLIVDMDGDVRPTGVADDVGADEWTGADSSAPLFDHCIRSVPREGAVYLEWVDASDTGEPISYLLFGNLISGGHTFVVPNGMTLDTEIDFKLPFPGAAHYIVPRAEDCFGNQTSNTDQYTYYPAENMISEALYNSDFEWVPSTKPGSRSILSGAPEGWSASGQEYGDKTSYVDTYHSNPYEGGICAVISTSGTPVDPNDLSITSLVADNSVALEKDHVYAVSAAVKRNDSQWARFILFSAGFSIIHTESIDALDDKLGDTGWEIKYFHFRAPSNINAYVRIDSIVSNKRTINGRYCKMWVDDVQIVDMGIETYTDIYNVTPPPPQYGIRNRYFDLGTDSETSTIGGTAYTCTAMPKRWNMSMAVDTGSNNAAGYPVWGQETPPGLADTTGAAGYVKARAMDTSGPAWPALSADGVNINVDSNNGEQHVLTFDYGSVGTTRPLLRTFMISNDFSHYSSLFVDPSVGIPGNRMWPLSLHYTPAFGDSLILVRFDNVTLGAAGGGPHTDETTVYVDNVKVCIIND